MSRPDLSLLRPCALPRLRWSALLLSAVWTGFLPCPQAGAQFVPDEPVEIGRQPQLFVDDYLVDNRYAIKSPATQMVLRVFHQPVKHGDKPVLIDPGAVPSHHALRLDRETGLFRLWYQANVPVVTGDKTEKGTLFGHKHIRYAESADGVRWTLPELGLVEYQGNTRNNICLIRPGQFTDPRLRRVTGAGISSMCLLNENEMPEVDRRGYKYLMTYTLRGGGGKEEEKTQVYLIGSRDGIHWDRDNQSSLYTGAITDGWMGMLYDSARQTYVSYCRPRDRYESGGLKAPGDDAFKPGKSSNFDFYVGVVRRIGRMERGALWQSEEAWPRSILLPDEKDHRNGVTAHMNMRARRHGGVYFGLLTPFVPKELVWTELVFSRDGKAFERTHEPFIANGPEGAWDSHQVWAQPEWVEVGEEWWIPYWGANAGPNTPFKDTVVRGIGLAKIRKEGFVSLRAPEVGGVVVTRLLRWPGGELLVNAGTAQGELRVRVTDRHRRAFDGFNYADCAPLNGDSTAHAVRWQGRALDSLKDELVRLEFYFSKQGDLYSFRAAPP